MAVVRRNILGTEPANIQARDRYVQGVKLLKQEQLGPTTQDLGIPGPAVPVSTYDLFVAWHHVAMFRFTPPSQQDRNAAHRGPVFLPWHRFMLLLLELQLQRVLDDEDFGLPYWDWAADGNGTAAQQLASPVWGPQCMGGQGNPVTTGPFAFNPADPQTWRVRLASNSFGQLLSVNRGLRRRFAFGIPTLPNQPQVDAALLQPTYDSSPWNTGRPDFRNLLEGWRPFPNEPSLHNRVHVWVGGDMGPASSPNDPVFYLNHCNVDRIWAAWQVPPRPIDSYLPGMTEPATLLGHRIDDDMFSLLTDPVTPRQMLDVSDFYSYDTLS
jgi:tyrosinase